MSENAFRRGEHFYNRLVEKYAQAYGRVSAGAKSEIADTLAQLAEFLSSKEASDANFAVQLKDSAVTKQRSEVRLGGRIDRKGK